MKSCPLYFNSNSAFLPDSVTTLSSLSEMKMLMVDITTTAAIVAITIIVVTAL
jgi:hypothetical protein